MAHTTDNSHLIARGDITAALGLLSRLPIRVDTDPATARGAKSAWAYPLVGLILGALACIAGQIALWLGLPNGLTAGVMLATLAIITGAMHEDGLADTADGFWGGWDSINRLKIMKDSHIGTYGVLALTFGIGLRWQALALIIAHDMLWPSVIATAMLSRAVMVPVMAHVPHARVDGLSHSVGRPSPQTGYMALAVAAFAALILLHLWALWLIALALLTAFLCTRLAKAKINGQTGDTLGATQQLTDIAMLLTLAALVS